MRKRIFEIVEIADERNKISHIYDVFMILVIVLSLIPLAIKDTVPVFVWTERITTSIFIIDYILLLITADLKLQRGAVSFLLFPFTAMAIIDLVSILASVLVMNSALRVFKVFRLIKALRVLKIFKGFRYSKNITIITNVLKKYDEEAASKEKSEVTEQQKKQNSEITI